MNFANAMYRAGSEKLTENGAFAYDSTAQGALLDLFSQIGALRPRTEDEIARKFAAAFKEDKLLATKMMFYACDIFFFSRRSSIINQPHITHIKGI